MRREQPKLSVAQVKTYSVKSPVSTHFKKASCADAGCSNFSNGWVSLIDEGTPLGVRQADYIRTSANRAFTESKDEAGLTKFLFPAGERCFTPHKVPEGKPELYYVSDGDWRGNPTGKVRKHDSPENWVEDFAQHQERLAKGQS